ncbi:MAG: ATP-grasp domain-containing protein [Cyanosarcina radialis HA8281-LM2]|jgi:hypothetical protein|nr:ATP-grasp domain-containing protein [Cyanosarcina radialis HA8281-LM2]
MKVFIRKDAENEFTSVNSFVAYDGFRKMGWEILPFSKKEPLQNQEPANVVVGYINDVRIALENIGIIPPDEINYPEELRKFLGRKIWKSKINYIANHPEKWNIFVKPVYTSKKFTGRLVRSTKDLISCGDEREDTEIWCSEPVKFIAEWRCFVRYGKILDVRRYEGDWRVNYDYRVIERALEAYKSAPKAYAMDFGLTDKGETLLVEVNDGYSVGSYGLLSLDYAKFLSARWAEITGTKDDCDF